MRIPAQKGQKKHGGAYEARMYCAPLYHRPEDSALAFCRAFMVAEGVRAATAGAPGASESRLRRAACAEHFFHTNPTAPERVLTALLRSMPPRPLWKPNNATPFPPSR